MHLKFRNVNDGFRGFLSGILAGSIPTERAESRNGPVIRCTEPMLLTFERPRERVLFNAVRDVNPFSLLYESLWTLAGRDDVEAISYYTKRMREFSDNGTTWHGAYGRRWRRGGRDQLDRTVDLLSDDPDSRRVVLTMWDADEDLHGQRSGGRDYPCNTHCYLTVRQERLSITVCNRSNDGLWGLFGTNYVVFSFLLEYLAARIGREVGSYTQMSNDLHVYADRPDWKPDELLAADDDQPFGFHVANPDDWGAQYRDWKAVPLVKDPATFERELPLIVEQYSGKEPMEEPFRDYAEPFFNRVAQPMFDAWLSRKKGACTVREHLARIKADDWRIACEWWVERRDSAKEVIRD